MSEEKNTTVVEAGASRDATGPNPTDAPVTPAGVESVRSDDVVKPSSSLEAATDAASSSVDAQRPDRPAAQQEAADEPAGVAPKGRTTEEPEDAPARPSFRAQGQEGQDAENGVPAKPREEGSTGIVRQPSVADRDPKAFEDVKGDFLLMLSESSEMPMFNGKRMTVTLGLNSKYIFDADRMAVSMRKGAAIRTSQGGAIETPDDIVIGRKGDEKVDPVKAKATKALRQARNAKNVDAVALQAAAVLAAREKGSTDPTPPVDAVKLQFAGNAALIVAERMDALNDVDLKAFAEKRTAEVTIAACMMMSHGKESPDPTRAAEAIRDSSRADEQSTQGVEDSAKAVGEQSVPATDPQAKDPEASSHPAAVGKEQAAADPVTSVLTPTEDVGRAQPAANDPQIAANDPAPRTLADQARMLSGEPHDIAVSKGRGDAANDGAVILAMGDRAKGRE